VRPYPFRPRCRSHGWGALAIVLVIGLVGLLVTLLDRWQLLQARAPACLPRVAVTANALTARCALLQRGVRVCGPLCLRRWGQENIYTYNMCVCVCVCGCVCVCVCVCTYDSIYAYVYVHVHLRARPWGNAERKGRVALQAFSDLLSGSAYSRSQGFSTFMLVGAPSTARARTRSYRHILLAHTRAQPPTHTHTRVLDVCACALCVRAVRVLSYMANFLSVFAVSTISTASIALLLFWKPHGRSRRTRHTYRLCFKALCWVCAPPASTQSIQCEYFEYPLLGMLTPASTQCTQCEYFVYPLRVLRVQFEHFEYPRLGMRTARTAPNTRPCNVPRSFNAGTLTCTRRPARAQAAGAHSAECSCSKPGSFSVSSSSSPARTARSSLSPAPKVPAHPLAFCAASSSAALLAALVCSSDALLWVGGSDRRQPLPAAGAGEYSQYELVGPGVCVDTNAPLGSRTAPGRMVRHHEYSRTHGRTQSTPVSTQSTRCVCSEYPLCVLRELCTGATADLPSQRRGERVTARTACT